MEILVVMVVLLVGIMTVVQMFPTGFRVVRAAESQTIATRLAQQELERWKSMSANLPTGILPVDDETGNIAIGQLPGPPWTGLAVVNGAYVRGSALNTRQVIGETTTIPVGTYFTSGSGTLFGAKYTLAFSPIDVTLGSGGLVEGIAVKSGDLRRKIGEHGEAPPYLRPGEYAVDYTLVDGKFRVAFPPDPGAGNRLYYISYSFWASTGGGVPVLFSVLDQPVTVSGDKRDWEPVPVTGIQTGYQVTEVDSDSDTCARGFEQWTGPFLDNPYQFKLADSIMGVIAFNPTGHGKYEYTAQGVRPIQARIDYRIYDPRIIREDRTCPQPKQDATGTVLPIPVKMSLSFILNIGDPTDDPDLADPDATVDYAGLIPPGGSQELPLPVLVMDLATGLRVDFNPIESTKAGDPGVDFKNGIVRLPATAGLVTYGHQQGNPPVATVPLAGRHLRFYYRADGDWSIQCSKAYASYTRRWDTADVDYRSYMVAAGDTTSGLSNRLLFAKCELGKSVVVDYTYVTPDGVEHKTAGEAHQIDFAPDGTGDVCVDLKNPNGTYISKTGRMIVVGSSFTAKVIWRDGKVWRHVQMDTNLTRTQ